MQKEVKEKLTAWSLRVAENEHQFKAIDQEQKAFLVREMLPKDIKREFLTGPRKFDEIIEKLEIIVNEMMANNEPVPMDLENLGAPDAKMTPEGFGHEQRHVIRRRMCDRLDSVPSWQGNRQERTERIRNVASWTKR